MCERTWDGSYRFDSGNYCSLRTGRKYSLCTKATKTITDWHISEYRFDKVRKYRIG